MASAWPMSWRRRCRSQKERSSLPCRSAASRNASTASFCIAAPCARCMAWRRYWRTELKNPLAGIRGAAQLLEDAVPDSEKNLTQLICDETDRIRNLIDRMESFGDTRSFPRKPVNIHEVLDRVRKIATTSFAREVHFTEVFDPSLPFVLGDFDQLVLVFLYLFWNVFDALPEGGGEIALT